MQPPEPPSRQTRVAPFQAGRVFKTTLIVVGTLLGLWALYLAKVIVVVIIVSIIFGAAIEPLVERFEHRGIPRSASILLVYLMLIIVFGVILVLVVPPLVQETAELITEIPAIAERIDLWLHSAAGPLGRIAAAIPNLDAVINQAINAAPALAPGLFRFTLGAFGTFVTALLVFVVTFYWLLERHRVEDFVFGFFPKEHRLIAMDIWKEVQQKLGAYVRGQITLGLAVGAAAFVGLLVLGMDFVLVLAVVAAVTELIPMIGPFLGAIPAVVIGLAESPIKGALVALLYLVIQQLENNLLVPKIMQRAVGISPLLVLLAILIGSTLLGVVGAILAVPVTATLQVIVERLVLSKRRQEGAAN